MIWILIMIWTMGYSCDPKMEIWVFKTVFAFGGDIEEAPLFVNLVLHLLCHLSCLQREYHVLSNSFKKQQTVEQQQHESIL